MLSRRNVIGKLAAGTAAICSAGVARASFASFGREPDAPTGATFADGQHAAAPNLGAAAGELGPRAQGGRDSLPQVPAVGPPTTLSAPPPWELVRPLAIGSLVAHGWRVAALTGVVDGSCVLTLQNIRGREHRVHFCRNDGRPHGVVYTKQLDLVVMNGGAGDLPTDEGLAQAVAEVAHVLAANERRREQAPVVTALLSHAERVRLFEATARLR